MLLCYSFVQFVVRLFDDLNDDAEYHYIYPQCIRRQRAASDVNVRRRTRRQRWTCVAACLRAATDVDVRLLDACRCAWTCVR